MVKSTDELPEDSKEKKKKPKQQAAIPTADHQESDSSSDLSAVETPESSESLPGDDEMTFVTSDDQDPTAIAMQINQGNEDSVGLSLDLLDEDDLLQQVAGVFVLWWHWAYFEISVVSPNFPTYAPPKILHPEVIPGTQNEFEFVYDICDHGYKLVTSKGSEMYSAGMSMCKLFYTIEKMIFILIKRLNDEGIGTVTEVQVMFDGHLLAQRKAFESIINLNYNVVVTNFDPGTWGERYLEVVKRLADRGYGYPAEAPREIYKLHKKGAVPKKS